MCCNSDLRLSDKAEPVKYIKTLVIKEKHIGRLFILDKPCQRSYSKKQEEKVMNIKDFSYIVAVAEYGSYSKAAEALYLSQPWLSAYIHGL